MLCELKRSPLTDMPHLIIQTAEFWRAGGGEAESCISDHRSMYNWKWCGLHALLSCVLSPILISRGASWRAGRTAVHLAARRLFISSASPLSACLPASTAKQPNAQRQTVRAFRLSRTSPAFIFLVYFLFPTLFLDSCICKHLFHDLYVCVCSGGISLYVSTPCGCEIHIVCVITLNC